MDTLDHVYVETQDKLLEPGDAMPVSAHIELDSYRVGQKTYRLPHGIDYDIDLTHAGDGILASGIVRAQAEGECDRCLEPAQFDISAELNEYYLFEAPESPSDDDDFLDEDDSDAFEVVGQDNVIDLAGALNDAIVMETPFVLLCSPDCKGLCPHCGCNLNYESCNCNEQAKQDELDNNPFAVLKNLKFDE